MDERPQSLTNENGYQLLFVEEKRNQWFCEKRMTVLSRPSNRAS